MNFKFFIAFANLFLELQSFSLSDAQSSVLESRAYFNYSNQLFSDSYSENKLYFINGNSIFSTGIIKEKA